LRSRSGAGRAVLRSKLLGSSMTISDRRAEALCGHYITGLRCCFYGLSGLSDLLFWPTQFFGVVRFALLCSWRRFDHNEPRRIRRIQCRASRPIERPICRDVSAGRALQLSLFCQPRIKQVHRMTERNVRAHGSRRSGTPSSWLWATEMMFGVVTTEGLILVGSVSCVIDACSRLVSRQFPGRTEI
jgi:hypothetical protein